MTETEVLYRAVARDADGRELEETGSLDDCILFCVEARENGSTDVQITAAEEGKA